MSHWSGNIILFVLILIAVGVIFGGVWGLSSLGAASQQQKFNQNLAIMQTVCSPNPDSVLCVQAVERATR